MSAGTCEVAEVIGSVRMPVVWIVLVAGIEPQGRIEPKMLGAVTLGKGPWMMTSPSGPVLVIAGVKGTRSGCCSFELPMVCWVWIEPPSPRRPMVSMTEFCEMVILIERLGNGDQGDHGAAGDVAGRDVVARTAAVGGAHPLDDEDNIINGPTGG